MAFCSRSRITVPFSIGVNPLTHRAFVADQSTNVGTILDQQGIAIRTGHHCSQPIMQRFDIPATARASFALYNTTAEVEALVRGIEKVREVFA